MKLIFVNRYFHPDISATSQMLSGLAFHLAGEGAEVHVVSSRQRYDDPAAALPPVETVRGVKVHRVWTSRFGRVTLLGRALDYASFYVAASIKLASLIRRGDLVVAKTDPPLISVPALLVSRLRGARLVNWLQDLFPEVAERAGMRLGGLAGIARAARNLSIRRAAANVVLGERMRSEVEAIAGAGPVRVIHNWADGAQIVPLPAHSNAMREGWGLEDKFVVAYSGNMGRAHEFATVLGAAEKLRDHGRIAFLFVGGGHQRESLEAGFRARGLSNAVFRPYQPPDMLAASLGAGDVHLITLVPSMEGAIVPSKVYGILAAGRPALNVGDPRGEVAAILESAKAGFTVPSGDSASLAQRILELASTPALCAELGANARAAFDARYSERIAFERWRQILLEAEPAALG